MLQQLKQHILEQERLHGSTLIDLRRDFNTKLSRRLRGGGGGGFQILVQNGHGGGIITIQGVDHTTTIYDLKKKRGAHPNTPHVDEQILSVRHGNGGTLQLDDVKTIGSYSIPEGKIFLKWNGGNTNLYNVTILHTLVVTPAISLHLFWPSPPLLPAWPSPPSQLLSVLSVA